ncbi:MAG: glycerophosphodiester phosphodiesterase family protein [Patescibacteria group bacterium]|jgi:glycerophosphoryl diester phosphodiesterase
MLVIAHQGASGYRPGNTLAAFTLAVQLGADMIELDVQATADGKLAVIHDASVDRTSNGLGDVSSLTLAQIQQFKIQDSQGEWVPALDEVLEILAGSCITLNVELKSRGTGAMLAEKLSQLDATMRADWKAEDILVTSTSFQEIAAFHRLRPDIQIGLIIYQWPLSLKAYQGLGLSYLIASKKMVNQQQVLLAHAQGFKFLVSVVNEQAEIREFINMGVDGIFSDFPDRVRLEMTLVKA